MNKPARIAELIRLLPAKSDIQRIDVDEKGITVTLDIDTKVYLRFDDAPKKDRARLAD